MPVPEHRENTAASKKDGEPLRATTSARPSLRGLLGLRALESLRYREFRLLWYGQIFTSMATWMDSIARGWLIYELTNSSFQLGLVRGVQAIPTLLLSPIAGSAADLYSRKTQIMIAQIVDGLLYAWVAVMIITGEIQPWHVYATPPIITSPRGMRSPRKATSSELNSAPCWKVTP